MAQATEQLGAARASDTRIVGIVSAAHFVSHYYILILPPLFAFVRADYGVSYTELGFALAAFNVVSAALQTPAGFLVDRFGARALLIAGLLFGAIAFTFAGLVNSFWFLVLMFGLAGIGNAIYHPADYALLSQQVSPARIGRAYSIHTFAGMVGSAAAPASLLMMQSLWGWRGALLGASVLGYAVALLLAMQPAESGGAPAALARPETTADSSTGWRLLTSAPILLNLMLFTLLALINGGLQNYSVVALGALYETPAATANAALSTYLLLAAGGVLLGGAVATRSRRYGLLATAGVVAIAGAALLIAAVDLGGLLLIAAMAVAGLFTGAIMPSRDLLVREITPPGAFGKVFGFVTTGYNIAGIVSPMIFGLALDFGSPRLVFVIVAAFCLMAVGTVAAQSGKPADEGR